MRTKLWYKNGSASKDREAFSWKAVLIGTAIIGIISYLCPIIEQYEWEIDYTIPAPPVSVMFFFFLVVMINALIHKFSERLSLDSNELLLIYAMTMVGAPLCSFGLVQFLIPNMVGPIHFATEENMWREDFLHYIPDWFGPRDRSVIDGFYTGGWDGVPWGAWIKPLLLWGIWALVFYFVLLCICAMIRKQWVERERLTFRILETPLAMAEEPKTGYSLNSFFRNKMTWIGFSIPILIQLSVGLHHYFPAFPSFKIMHIRLDRYFTEKPWNAIGYFHISVMYSIIGIAYMVPADVSLSCWFFYLLKKSENVFAAAMGWRGGKAGGFLASFPDVNDQAVGAFFALFFLSLWMMRRHLWKVFKDAFSRSNIISYDPKEAMSYSTAVFGFIFGTAFLIFWTWIAGLSPIWAFVFFGIFFIFQTVLSRIRAESGMAWLFLPKTPNNVMVLATGTAKLGVQNLAILSSLKFHTFDQNGYIMPFQLEALKISDTYSVKGRHVTLAIFIGMIFYIGISSWSSLSLYYNYGADACEQWRVSSGRWAFDELERWINNPLPSSPTALFFMVTGALFYVFLAFMRLRFLWWPFHPIGYAVANTFTMQYLWSPFFFGWLAKVVVLKFGGIKSYRSFVPFFLGLIMGETVGNGFWATVLGEILGIHGFAYFEF
ncbi:hypothetical protein H8E77_30705 [bacterium]|nr:hypothetical protein [bacterium]